jgi:deoxyribodipyrimidine photo-lyase
MPLIDALMREMNATGFMPNRGRMIVACYLTMDLKQDWRYGAHHFEEKLIDHDVQSNYGGWCGSSGIGAGRVLVFNSLKQSKDFDPNGRYIKMWCPELKNVGVDYIHDPWNMPKSHQDKYGVKLGTDYPKVIECLKYTNPEVAKKQKRDAVEKR